MKRDGCFRTEILAAEERVP